MDKGLVEQVVAAAASIVGSGAISANGHGNVSLRVPGADEMYFTSPPSLKGLGPDGVARVALDGTLLEGNLPPIQGAVAAYGPRGSEQAVANIRAAVRPGVPAVLLANHGVLVFHRTPELAVLVGGVVEEAAQAAINASALGGPVEIPADLRAAALQRAMAFDASGTKTA